MKKFLTIALLLASTAASADVLYWQINYSNFSGDSGNTYYSYVTSSTGDSSDYLLASWDNSTKKLTSDVGAWTLDFENYNSDTTRYVVELWTYKDASSPSRVCSTVTYSYADLVTAGAIYQGNTSLPTFSAGPSVTTITPEPTSGVLLLFGLASLALRRKRV